MLLTSPALAIEKTYYEDVNFWSVEAPTGYCISTVDVNNLEPDSTTQIVFDAYGKIYSLDVVSTKSSLGWWEINLTLDGPEGIQTKNIETFKPFATDFDIKVQYFYYEADSILDADIYIGLLPLTAQFFITDVMFSSLEKSTHLAFSSVSGSTSVPADLTIILSTADEFIGQQKGDGLQMLKQMGIDIFTWTWEAVLAFLEQIPGVGPYLVSSIEIIAMLAGGAIFYFDLLFIQYPTTTFLTIEFFILSSAIIKTKRNASIARLVDQTIEAHINVIEFFIGAFSTVLNLLINIVSTIAQIVRSLKPI
jgi:hypothetical protein